MGWVVAASLDPDHLALVFSPMKPDNAPRLAGDNQGEQGSGGGHGRHQQENVARERTPLPIKQVFVLCLMSFAEPVSIFVVSLLCKYQSGVSG
ncbi:hypothetical protein RSAG8_07231, partial [Rhizoctonia solani AG-8 WAC10335]